MACVVTSKVIADEEVRLPSTNKINIIPCFYRQGSLLATAEGVTEKSLGNGAILTQAFREQFSKAISTAGYEVIGSVVEDVCPIKDGMVEPEGIIIVVMFNALGAAFRDDVIAVRGHLKVPGQPRLLPGQGDWLNGIKGIGPKKASHEIAAKLIEQIRTQKKSNGS